MAAAGVDGGELKCFSSECKHSVQDFNTQQTSTICCVCKQRMCHECYKQHTRAPSESPKLPFLAMDKVLSTLMAEETSCASSTEERTSMQNDAGIYVKSEKCEQSNYSNRPCCITGSVIMCGSKMAVCDYSHCILKYINLEDSTVVSEFVLDNHPWSVCHSRDTEVAVTLSYTQMIVFVQLEPTPAMVRVVEVGAECCGVACLHDEKLVVTFADKNAVAIVDFKGNVLRSFSQDSNGHLLFSSPQYVTVNVDQDMVYVSNFHTNHVVCMTLKGELKYTYKDEDLKGPSQIAMGQEGMLYICGHYSQNIHKVTADGQKVEVKNTKVCIVDNVLDGEDRPWSISYHQGNRKLYVGNLGNYIKQCVF